MHSPLETASPRPSPRKEPTGPTVQPTRHHRPCVHIQPDTRTIPDHWGLPHLWHYRPGPAPVGNPRSHVSEAPARTHIPPSGAPLPQPATTRTHPATRPHRDDPRPPGMDTHRHRCRVTAVSGAPPDRDTRTPHRRGHDQADRQPTQRSTTQRATRTTC